MSFLKKQTKKLLFVFLCFIFSDLIQYHGWGGQGQVMHEVPKSCRSNFEDRCISVVSWVSSSQLIKIWGKS